MLIRPPPPPHWSTQTQPNWPECDLSHCRQWTGDVKMIIHVARTPPFHTAFTHTCCQGQTSCLTVRPDVARCTFSEGTVFMRQNLTSVDVRFPLLYIHIMGSICAREVACSDSDLHDSNFEFCVWRAVSSHSSHHFQEVLLAQLSLHGPKTSFISIYFLYICYLVFYVFSRYC